MSAPLHLTITTPARVLVDRADVVSVRAEDEKGGFGILPGHTDLLTVLPPSVVRWRGPDRREQFCVVRGGVLTITGGHQVAVACREGTVGSDLPRLVAEVDAMRAAEADADRKARVEQVRLHAQAVRQLMRYLAPGPLPSADAVTSDGTDETP